MNLFRRQNPVGARQRTIRALVLASALSSMSCTGKPQLTVIPPRGWLTEIALEPQKWLDVVDGTSRDGWAAMHAHQYEAAITAFEAYPSPRARAELALAALHDDIDRVERVASRRLFERWAERGELPPGAAAVAALNELCHGNSPDPWLNRVGDGPGSRFVASLAGKDALWPTDSDGSDPLVSRRAMHRKARDGSPDALNVGSTTPLFAVQAGGDGFVFDRKFWDPCAHRTLADYWLGRASRDLGGDLPGSAATWTELDGRLLAGWSTADDIRAESAAGVPAVAFGATMPSLEEIGLSREPAGEDRLEVAREEARTLESALDAWRTSLATEAPPDGRNLLEELRLFDRFRQEWLLARARKHLAEGRRRQALALAHLARDASQGVGPGNSPSVYAVLAAAELENGHTREALDALQTLARARPEIVSVREIVSDLAVLEGIDRNGDSKEN